MRKESRHDTQSCQHPKLFLYETRVTAYRQDSESQKIKVRGGVENLLLLLTSRVGNRRSTSVGGKMNGLITNKEKRTLFYLKSVVGNGVKSVQKLTTNLLAQLENFRQ